MGKVIGWFFGMTFLIAGFGLSKDYSETGNMTVLGVAILSFGCVFWLSKVTYATSKRVITYTTAIMMVTGLISWLVLGDYFEMLTGLSFYFVWEICMLLVGVPIMHKVFSKED